MKESTLAVHLFVCGGDLMVSHDASVPCSILSAFLYIFSSLFLFPAFSPHFPVLLPLPPSIYFCARPPVRACDSCSLFIYILFALHIYKAERFTLSLTLNA